MWKQRCWEFNSGRTCLAFPQKSWIMWTGLRNKRHLDPSLSASGMTYKKKCRTQSSTSSARDPRALRHRVGIGVHRRARSPHGVTPGERRLPRHAGLAVTAVIAGVSVVRRGLAPDLRPKRRRSHRHRRRCRRGWQRCRRCPKRLALRRATLTASRPSTTSHSGKGGCTRSR